MTLDQLQTRAPRQNRMALAPAVLTISYIVKSPYKSFRFLGVYPTSLRYFTSGGYTLTRKSIHAGATGSMPRGIAVPI